MTQENDKKSQQESLSEDDLQTVVGGAGKGQLKEVWPKKYRCRLYQEGYVINDLGDITFTNSDNFDLRWSWYKDCAGYSCGSCAKLQFVGGVGMCDSTVGI